MVFIAVEDVCEFKKGDIVPEDRGRVWFNMYTYPPVKWEELAEEPSPEVPEPELKLEKKHKCSREPEKKHKRSRKSKK